MPLSLLIGLGTFYRGLLAGGVSDLKSWMMYSAVSFEGPDRWDVDPNATAPAPCREMSSDGRIIHNNYQYLTEDQRRIFVAKHFAMVRTFATTEGRYIDVVDGTPVPVDGALAAKHLMTLRKAVESRLTFPRHRSQVIPDT
jgi:hypothetical protein